MSVLLISPSVQTELTTATRWEKAERKEKVSTRQGSDGEERRRTTSDAQKGSVRSSLDRTVDELLQDTVRRSIERRHAPPKGDGKRDGDGGVAASAAAVPNCDRHVSTEVGEIVLAAVGGEDETACGRRRRPEEDVEDKDALEDVEDDAKVAVGDELLGGGCEPAQRGKDAGRKRTYASRTDRQRRLD